jgi:hypothetical protein
MTQVFSGENNRPKGQGEKKMKTIEKGRIVKYIIVILFFVLSICSAKTDEKPQESSPCCKLSSLEADCYDLVEWQNEIKKSIDSIAIKATEKYLELHGKSYEKMQASYSNFVSKMNVFVGIMAIFVAIMSIIVTVIGWDAKKRIGETIKEEYP